MDRGKIAVHQLDDTEYEIAVRCFEGVHIFDNCNNQLCNHASCAPSHVAVETNEPKSKHKTPKQVK